MRVIGWRLALSMIATLAGLASQPATAEALRPAGAWIIDFNDTECTALRKFGAADDPVDFMIRPGFNGQSFELFVGRKDGGRAVTRTRQGTVDLGRGDLKQWFVTARPKQSEISVFRVRLADHQLRSSGSVKKIRLKVGAEDFHLATGGLGNVMKTLDTCVADLRDYWNDGVPNNQVATPATGDLRSVFRADDYPSEALVNEVEGAVSYTLLIDQTGAVVGCDPLKATAAPLLELMGCQVIVARAKFKPARDSAGRGVRETIVTPPITWRLED